MCFLVRMKPKTTQMPPISDRQRKRMASGSMEANIGEYGPKPGELAEHARKVRHRLEDIKLAKSLGIDLSELS